MIDLYLSPMIIIIAIMIQAFFSNSEMAMVSSNRIKLNYKANNGNKRAQIVLNLLNKPDQLFGTTLVGINFATVISTAVADYYFHDVFIKYYPVVKNFISIELLIFIIMEPLILIFGELLPMSIARKYPNTVALRNAYFIKIGYVLFFPLMFIVSNISKFINSVVKAGGEGGFGKISRDELELLVSGRFSHINENTRKIIRDVFDIKELSAKDIMTHLNEVKSISSESSIEDLKELIRATNFSRFPVYSGSIFNIIATIHAVNILELMKRKYNAIYRKTIHYTSSKPVVQILSDLKRNRKYMGIVVDEYGSVCGIVTIENISEELIGEAKEMSDDSTNINDEKDNIFDAKTYLDDFYDKTGIDFTDTDFDTLGGIINLALGRIAKKGDRVSFRDVDFEVIEATDRVVKKIKLIKN